VLVGGLVEADADTLQLQARVAVVRAGRVDAGLDVRELAHHAELRRQLVAQVACTRSLRVARGT
jgi:hypothetical protein